MQTMVRGQMKIQQMAFVLIAVMIFLVFVGLFVLAFSFSGLKKTANEQSQNNAKLLVSKLANSPEFSCGGAFGSEKVNCINFDKVMGLKGKYTGFWDVSRIEIRKMTDDKACTSSNYPNCGRIVVYSKEGDNGAGQSNFVSLCRKEVKEGVSYNLCEMAKLIVNYEVKK